MSRDPTLLVVDDEPIGRAAFQSLLAGQGYRLEYANDGPSALQKAADLLPDLIILDVMMPGMDGFEVTRRVRALPALAEVPILLVTALDDPASRLAGLEAGADDFITKPVDRIEMRARVRAITRLNRFRRLLDERSNYQRLFEDAPCGLLVLEEQTAIVQANAIGRQLLGRWRGNQSLTQLAQLLPASEAERLAQLLAEAEANPRSRPQAEFHFQSNAKEPVWIHVVVSLFPSASRPAFQVALTDRTPERLLEEELRQAQKIETIGQLAGGIAHDLNNVLTVINGFTALALGRLAPGDSCREHLQQVVQAGQRAANLTRQLLLFSKKQILAPVDLDLNALIRDLEKMIRRLIGENIAVRTRLASDVGAIRADPVQIEQILFNLATNARDAMSGGGTLTFETSPWPGNPGEEACVRLTVEDTGCGISPEVQARMFEPFFTTKEAGKGTGLGLATVQRILQQCRARLKVTSQVGVGTRFQIDFPQVGASPNTPMATASETESPRYTETILVAEDDFSVRTMARFALQAVGYQVLAAGDGEEALREVKKYMGPIHLLFTDAVMPKLGGRDLSELVRPLQPGIKVLFTSGYDDSELTRTAVLQGKVAFLPKPYTPALLLKKVREVLDP
ncbi:MAG: response regulator [Gemmataceae bacterium]